MHGRLLMLAIAVFTSCAAAVTSSSSAETRTDPAWSKAADQICRAYLVRAKALGAPPVNDLDASARWLKRALPVLHGQIAELARLRRPAALAPSISRWIGVLRASERVTRQSIAALEAHDVDGLVTIAHESVVLYRRSARMARALGARTCATSANP